jgi:hypothetical protein
VKHDVPARRIRTQHAFNALSFLRLSVATETRQCWMEQENEAAAGAKTEVSAPAAPFDRNLPPYETLFVMSDITGSGPPSTMIFGLAAAPDTTDRVIAPAITG